MPMYTYECTNEECKEKTDSIEKYGTEDIECPKCKEKAQKVFNVETPPSFQLKGRGWYKDGY